MNTTENMLDTLKSRLPQAWHDTVDELAARTLQIDAPLRLTLVGGFSVGKSSLLNMLIGEKLLFTAKEEATALPTFIEHGARALSMIGSDGSSLPLDAAHFQQVTTNAPAGAACAVLALPLDWLQGVVVIDLPGLGSVSAAHKEYTLAQIQQTDAVLYLIEPRGPTQSDLETLTMIRRYGKRVKMLVARWDEVEAAILRGEKEPNLAQWSTQIAEKTGVSARLAPVSHSGRGRDDVLDFVARAREDVAAIRLSRFTAELLPALHNALGSNAAEQQACTAQSEEAVGKLHAEVLESKQQLVGFKTALYARQQLDKQAVEQQCNAVMEASRKQLRLTLQSQTDAFQGEAEWDAFCASGADTLRGSLASLAAVFSEQSTSYGELQLPAAVIEQFNLRLSAPESVDAGDFLETAKLSKLSEELACKQAEFDSKQEKLRALPEAGLDAEEQSLRELMLRRQQIADEPLARIVRRTEGNGAAEIGRMIGGLGDLALVFVNPSAVGIKAASLLAKGANAVNVAVKTKQIGSALTKGIKFARAVQAGVPNKIVPAPIMQKLGMLEMFSLGYWGEKLGTALGGGATEHEEIDPEARAAQERALAEVNGTIQNLRRELARKEDIANERQLTGWALEQSKLEQIRLQAEIERLNQQAEQRLRIAQQALLAERREIVRRHAERAVAQWLRSYDQQSASMATLLLVRVKQYWESHVEATLEARMAELNELENKMQAAPQDKALMLDRLCEDASALHAVIQDLT